MQLMAAKLEKKSSQPRPVRELCVRIGRMIVRYVIIAVGMDTVSRVATRSRPMNLLESATKVLDPAPLRL